uniref:Metallo-beta-lactamase domain-containing protein n=2 Tax=Aplanochytrium stocchinoi TaxID=215587 RepID=A0A7S3LJV9_9STRA
MDWHETIKIKSDDLQPGIQNVEAEIEISAVPMQHWSSRRGFDRDETLWCGYSLAANTNTKKDSCKVLFAGDTGMFDGLHEIGEKYGPYDLAAIPIGAYEPRDFMKGQHTNPEDAVEMMRAIQARKAVPIHWGTFQLTFEPVLEPRERLIKAVKQANLPQDSFSPWLIGSTIVC